MRFGHVCLLAASACAVLAAGCNYRPGMPLTESWGRPDKIAVIPGDADEVAGAKTMELARADYRYKLTILQGYYDHVGNSTCYNYAGREIHNLDQAQSFTWENLPPVTLPAGESIAGADERQLVENVVSSRQAYLTSLNSLTDFYARKNDSYKRDVLLNVQKRFHPEETYTYITSAELPPADLRPTEVIPEADQMFNKAYQLFRDGKGPLFALTTDYEEERQALTLFQKLVYTYPRSNKIALSAYYIGDIYKEYYKDNVRAVQWYERAWQWDPNVPEPARFQAAVVYDIRLQDKAKAVKCYRDSLKFDPYRVANDSTARRRIKELTGQEQ